MERTEMRPPATVPASGRTRRFSVRQRVPALVAAVLAGTVGAGRRFGATAQAGTPDPREIETTVQGFYDALNSGDVDALDAVLAPDWADYPPPPGPGTNVENYRQVMLGFRAAFPDGFFATQDFIVEGNQVAVRSTGSGTHKGPFLGVAGTGTPVKFQTIDIHRVEGGRIVETYHVEDLLGVLIQVGGLPPAASPVPGTPAP